MNRLLCLGSSWNSVESTFVLDGVCGGTDYLLTGEGIRFGFPVPQSPVPGTRFELGHRSLYPITVVMS